MKKMDKLANITCIPYRKGDLPVPQEQIEEYLVTLPEWSITEREGNPRLERSYKFSNFQEALDFTNQVGELAEQADHHPAIFLTWGRVVVSWWTHIIEDLHINDFILAARTEKLYQNRH
jgi:4a-hydroxytetrahydrobiopterin dehydratase